MTYAEARQRVEDAGRAYQLACDAREKNHSPETAIAKAVAYQHFLDAQTALAKTEFL